MNNMYYFIAGGTIMIVAETVQKLVSVKYATN